MARARWRDLLDIAEDWRAAEKEQISVQCLAERIYPALERVAKRQSLDVTDLVDDLKRFSNNEKGDRDDFDELMDTVYDWGDKVGVWVVTEG